MLKKNKRPANGTRDQKSTTSMMVVTERDAGAVALMATSSFTKPPSDEIYIDSGATDHMSPRNELFTSIDASRTTQLSTATSGHPITTKGTGIMVINGKINTLELAGSVYE